MPHIHTEPGQHDITASAFIMLLGDGEPKLLLHQHHKLGKLMQYGGHVELDETPLEAALREIREESGYDADQLQVLQPVQHMTSTRNQKLDPIPACIGTHPYGGDTTHFHTDLSYAFITTERPRHKEAAGESDEHIQMTRAQLEAVKTPEDMFINVQKVGLFSFSLIDTWEPVVLREYRTSL
jgi:8-oxo-dGTP pyrophosphatase MutT (NUDIX family)